MNRLTHRVKLLKSVISTRSVPLPPLFPLPATTGAPRRRPLISGLRASYSISFALPAGRVSRRRMSDLIRPSSMESYIEDPNPNVESMSENFVGIDNVRKDNDAACRGGNGEGLVQGRTLPEELFRNVAVLSCESSAEGGRCDVYLVGTAHVSQESCRIVQSVISCLKPEVVFLEICSQRVAVLSPQNLKVPTFAEMVEMLKKKHNLFGILYSWFLAKVASKLEAFPGAEFRVAYEEAMKYGGKVVLGDRPLQITLRRTWDSMPIWHKTKLLYSFLIQAVFLPSPEDLKEMLKEMDDVDMMTFVIREMSKEFPTLIEALLHERDQYMSSSLLKSASNHSSVVAVVGKGHVNGIKKHWKQPVHVEELLSVPSRKSTSVIKILTSIGVAAVGAAALTGIYLRYKK